MAVRVCIGGEVVERRIRGQEVAGSSLTHCAVDYVPGQATYAHVPLLPSTTLWNWAQGGDALRLGR